VVNKRNPRFWFSIYGCTAVIMCIAVGVFLWLASESRKAAGEGRTANAHPPVKQDISEERRQALSQFDPPDYTPAPGDPAGFQRVMKIYAAHDYATAVQELRVLAGVDPIFVPARFYLGISMLQAHDHAGGIEQLRAVIAAPSSRYQEAAHFYLAKALLASGDGNAAEQELKAVVALHGPLEPQAHVLLGQIR
jgi:TolA-binding protein